MNTLMLIICIALGAITGSSVDTIGVQAGAMLGAMAWFCLFAITNIRKGE